MKKHQLGILVFILSLALMTLACGLGSAPAPTQEPPPVASATQPPADPTEPPAATEPSAKPTAIPPTEAPAEEKPTDEPAPPPPANEIAVDVVHDYIDNYDTLHIIGLVTNYTDRAVDSVEVQIEIFDADDNSLFTDVTYLGLSSLMPGETSPFHKVYNDLPDADHYAATIVGQSVSDAERATLKIDGDMLTIDDNGNLHVTGNLINNTDTPVDVRNMAVAIFDADGNLFTAVTYPSAMIRHLDPGEEGPFRITMTGPKDGTANIGEYTLYPEAENSDPADVYDLTFSEDNYYYIDTHDSFHLIGEITNNSDLSLSVSLVAGIYDADGNVLDAAITDLPLFSISPGQTMPYDFSYWGPLNDKASALDMAASYTVQWDPYWTWENSRAYVEISTQNDTHEVSSYQMTFTGEVLNDSDEDITGATVIVNMYDIETGELIATDYGGVYDEIPVNGIADYTIWLDIPDGFDINTVKYTIQAYGDLD